MVDEAERFRGFTLFLTCVYYDQRITLNDVFVTFGAKVKHIPALRNAQHSDVRVKAGWR